MTYKQDPMTDIPVSSLTYAIKGQRLLEQNGYTVWAGRDHDRVTGCGYKLTIRGGEDKAEMARALLAGRAPMLDARFAYHTQEVIQAVYDSSAERRHICVRSDLPRHCQAALKP